MQNVGHHSTSGDGADAAARYYCEHTLLHGRLVPATVTVQSGRLTAIDQSGIPLGAGDPAEMLVNLPNDVAIVPAPLDIHLHGGGGITVPPRGDIHDLCTALDTALHTAGWRGLDGSQSPYGFLATLPVPSRPPAGIVEQIEQAAQACAGAARCHGLRIEGLFVSPQRAGVWPPETFHPPDIGLADEVIAAGQGQLRMIDVAPELPRALELIDHLCSRGIIVSIAHTDATWQQTRAAIDAGATVATHLFNAMRPIHHREGGVAVACLLDERVRCELICDGYHVAPHMLAFAHHAARGGVVAISDASPYAGLPAGQHDWAGLTVTGDGSVLRDNEGRLAGSASLLTAAPAVLASAGLSIEDRAATVSAAGWQVLDPSRPAGLVAGDVAACVPLDSL